MQEFRAFIGDVGPSSAPNGRSRPRLHYVALTFMRRYPFERQPGEALCNPNLRISTRHASTTDDEAATCTKCLVRADRYGVQIVTTLMESEHDRPQ